MTLGNLGATALFRGDLQRAVEAHAESLALARQLDDPAGLIRASVNLAGSLWARGDLDDATRHYTEAVARARDIGDRRGEAVALSDLGRLALERANYEAARAFLADNLAMVQEMGDRPAAVGCVEAIAAVTGFVGDPQRAARLYAAAAALRAAIGIAREALEQRTYERPFAAVRAALDPVDFAAAWEAGQALSLDQAIDEALTLVAV